MDEQQLLAAWRDGDEDAGEILFERYYESLSRFFRSKAGEQAPDLIQRTFLVLVETQARIREGTTFQAYLFGVARNILLEHYRGKRRDGERFDPAERSVEDFGPTPTTLIAQVQETQLLLQALRKIPVESQMILELYYWESMTAKDIGDVLEIPEGTRGTLPRSARTRAGLGAEEVEDLGETGARPFRCPYSVVTLSASWRKIRLCGPAPKPRSSTNPTTPSATATPVTPATAPVVPCLGGIGSGQRASYQHSADHRL